MIVNYHYVYGQGRHLSLDSYSVLCPLSFVLCLLSQKIMMPKTKQTTDYQEQSTKLKALYNGIPTLTTV